MEDLNTIAADCAVISCCCQCLILQVLIFFMLKLPYRLFRKTRDYARKLRDRKRRRRRRLVQRRNQEEEKEEELGYVREGFFLNGNNHGFGCCMDEVEKVLEEFSLRGDFAFGSFWNREISKNFPSSCLANKELDYDDVLHCHLIQIFGSNFNCIQEQQENCG